MPIKIPNGLTVRKEGREYRFWSEKPKSLDDAKITGFYNSQGLYFEEDKCYLEKILKKPRKRKYGEKDEEIKATLEILEEIIGGPEHYAITVASALNILTKYNEVSDFVIKGIEWPGVWAETVRISAVGYKR